MESGKRGGGKEKSTSFLLLSGGVNKQGITHDTDN